MQAGLAEILWYWRRASSMSAPEFLHRAGEQTKRLVSRQYWPSALTGDGDFRALPFPGLDAGVDRLGADPVVCAQWRAIAEEAQQDRLTLLGHTWPRLGGPKKWHIDPTTGKSWPPDTYCFGIHYRHDASRGDIKYVWERNRLQYLQSVAAHARASGDHGAAQWCIAELESWIDANPPFNGVNWASGIELAVRIVSFIVIYTILGAERFSDTLLRKLSASFAAHGYWLMRFPSRFSSANNHLIAEASGLYVLGSLVPDLPGAARYRRYGFDILTREALRQIHPDGVGAEQSLTYTASTVEWLILSGELGRRLGQAFPEAYWDRIYAAGRFLASITDCRGNQPRLGDDDEGHVLDYRGPPGRYEVSVLNGIATLADEPGLFRDRRREAHLFHALLPGECRSIPPAAALEIYPNGGYSAVRSFENGTECLLLFDHGAVGYLSPAAHGHADTLGIWLHLNGVPVLVDGGTYLYHAGGPWRSYFRGSAAHNTLTIFGQDSSVMSSHFGWRKQARARLLSVSRDSEQWHVEAEHAGYESRFGIIHRRRLTRSGRGRFALTDTIFGRPVDGEIGFLIHPNCSVREVHRGWEMVTENGSRLRLSHDGTLRTAMVSGQTEPKRGWHSSRFGQKAAAPWITFSGKLAPGVPYDILIEVMSEETRNAEIARGPIECQTAVA
jgi:hypothetical protein